MFPLVRLIIPFVLGLVGANCLLSYVALPTEVLFPILCLSACLLVVLEMRKVKLPHTSSAFSIATYLFTFLFAFTLFAYRYQRLAESVPSEGQDIRASVISLPVEKTNSYEVKVKSEDGTHLLVYLAKEERAKALQLDDQLVLVPKYVNPTAPHLQTDSVFRTYQSYLFYSGTSATCYVPKRNWQTLSADSSSKSSWSFRSLQQAMHRTYERAGLTGETGAIIEAMTIGNRTKLTKQQRQEFGNAGISHILALSGFHLNTFLVVLNLFLFVLPISIRTRRIVALCALLPIIWLYTAIAGFPPSLVRAATMASILQVLLVVGREYHLLNTLCLTAILMLCWNPLQLMNVGFQLSFASMLGIALIIPVLMEFDEVKEMYKLSFLNTGNLILRFLIFVVVISLVCTLSTFPLVAYYFGQVPLLSLFSNVFATLLAYGIMFFSVLFWLFSFWHGAQTFIASILNLLAKGMETLTSFISSIPHSTLSFRPTIFEVILLYVAIVSLFLYMKKRTARPIIVLLATIILFSISRIVGNLFTLS